VVAATATAAAAVAGVAETLAERQAVRPAGRATSAPGPSAAKPLARRPRNGRAAVQQTKLGSGLRVVTERVPSALSVASGVWVGVGARDEPDELAGVSHFLEHLLFKGTEERSAHAIASAVDRFGGDMNAFTTKEYTAYYTRLPAEHLSLGLGILGDVLTAPALRDEDVESERLVILEELLMDEDSPEDRVHTQLYESLFPGHPLGRETAGHRDSVTSITGDDVRKFFGRWYRPASMVVSVAGPVGHDEVVALVEHAFDAPGGGEAPRREAPVGKVRPLAVQRRSVEQAHVALGFAGVSRDDDDREPLDVLNHVLGGGMSSRLFQEIRERRGLAYSVYSAPSSFVDTGALTVYAGTLPESVHDVLDLVDAEIQRVACDGITDDELDVARGYLCGAFRMGLEDTASRMARLGGMLTVLGRLHTVDDQVDKWRAVDHAGVARVAERVLGGPRALSVVGPVTRKSLAQRAR
jgi:predicted Zn-dependent peptidase